METRFANIADFSDFCILFLKKIAFSLKKKTRREVITIEEELNGTDITLET